MSNETETTNERIEVTIQPLSSSQATARSQVSSAAENNNEISNYSQMQNFTDRFINSQQLENNIYNSNFSQQYSASNGANGYANNEIHNFQNNYHSSGGMGYHGNNSKQPQMNYHEAVGTLKPIHMIDNQENTFINNMENTLNYLQIRNQSENASWPSNATYSGIPQEKFATRPIPQAMTAIGPVPMPAEIQHRLPEKFVAPPIIQEREIYISKKEVQERTVVIPHIKYEHKFSPVERTFTIDRLVPEIEEVVKEIPVEVYRPSVEEKIIDVPQGIKYVEVPIEVPCQYPPKIVPKPKIQIVERVVETLKPVVKEQVIEVPQTVVKHIPKIKTVEVPYYVPKYEEKIIEVPYVPQHSKDLPNISINPGKYPITELFAMQQQAMNSRVPAPYTLGPLPASRINEINLPYEARIEVKVVQPEFATLFKGGLPLQNMKSSRSIVDGFYKNNDFNLPFGHKWGAPPNCNNQQNQNFMGCFDKSSGVPKQPPMMVTCPPEIGHITFSCSSSIEPTILTRGGVLPFTYFKKSGVAVDMLPPLPFHPNVPMGPPPKNYGTPLINQINNSNRETHQKHGFLRN